jgi:hypothetical protein
MVINTDLVEIRTTIKETSITQNYQHLRNQEIEEWHGQI